MNKTPDNPSDSIAWNQQNLSDPHQDAKKADRVNAMFDAIADTYDLNNRIHSLWRDQYWRRKGAALTLVRTGKDHVVDVACGTGDLSLAFSEHAPASVTGIDFVPKMIDIARWKTEHKRPHHLPPRHIDSANSNNPVPWTKPQFTVGNAMDLQLPDASADIVSIAFGIRNISDPAIALREFRRILRPGGRLLILEFSLPNNTLLRKAYNFYFNQILPRTATFISRDKTGAYKYLPRSVSTFYDRDQLSQLILDAGFSDLQYHPLTFGVCIAYLAQV